MSAASPPTSSPGSVPGKSTRKRGVLGVVFLTAFLDLAGFSVIFPLFPQMLDYYVGLEGEQSLIGQLVAYLRGFAGSADDSEFLVITLFGGALGSLYALLQFVFAPVWGALSDRIGRRPTLLVTLAGVCVSYAIWFFAGSFPLLVLARLLGGMMAGNLSIASAAVADVTQGPERSKGMGILGAAIGLGFILGPAIGGLTAAIDLTEIWPGGAALGVNPFSAAALAALVLSLINWIWALTRFPETFPSSARTAAVDPTRPKRSANPLVLFTAVRNAGVQRSNFVNFFTVLAFSAMEYTLVFLAAERFAYDPIDNAKMFVFIGVVIALVQGGAIRRLAPRFGDKRLTITGIALIAPGLFLVGGASGGGALYGGLALMATGFALFMPCLSALVSRYAPADQQGLALGVFRSLGSLSRAFGPILGGILYWRLGSASPYTIAAAFLILPLGLALGLPRPAPGGAAQAPGGAPPPPGGDGKPI